MVEFDDEDKFQQRASAIALLEGDSPRLGRDGTPEEMDEIGEAEAVEAAMPMHDSLEQKRSLRGTKWQELNAIAPFSRVNPPSVLSGTLGGQQNIIATADELVLGRTRAIQVANWGGPDAETLPVTVTVSPVQQFFANNPAIIFVPPAPFAIVRFGTRGYLVEAEVDIVTGCQFTVSGSSVTVQVGFEFDGSIIAPPGFSIAGSMILAGMLSFYPVAHVLPITKTRIIYAIPEGVGFPRTVTVPAFAKNMVAWRTLLTNSLLLEFIDSLGVPQYSFTIAAGAVMFDPVPIASDIVTVRVTSLGVPFSTDTARLIFGLSF